MLFMSCVFHAFMSVHCCLVVTCREKACLFVMLMFFVTFPMWYPGSGVVFDYIDS